MRLATSVLAAAAALALAVPAIAHEITYSGQLLGSSEVPPNASPGSGFASATIDFDLLTMRVQASFTDLLGLTTAAHIHCCAPAGSNAGVATMVPSFDGFPLGVTSGTYDHTFDMADAASYNPTFITNNGGSVATAFNALVAGLDAGNAYFNVHTEAFRGGEIRAQLLVPEPETYALMLGGLGLVGWAARRRRQPS